MNWLSLIDLMQHMAVVILFLVIGYRLVPAGIHRRIALRNGIYGLLFGAAGISTMLFPLHEQAGTLAPMYFIVAGLAAWLGGPLSALVSDAGMIGVRIVIGGAGLETGIATILLATAIGLAFWRYRPQDRNRRLYFIHPVLFGVLVSIMGFGVAAVILPEEVRSSWLQRYTPSMFLLFPVFSVLVHYFISSEWTRKRRNGIEDMNKVMSPKLFREQLSGWIQARTPFCLALLDIDGETVQRLNRELSRTHLRHQVVQRLQIWLPSHSAACWLEGEQLLIAMTGSPTRKLPYVPPGTWDELQTLLSSPYWINKRLYHLTPRIAVTTCAEEDIAVDELLQRIYAALQHATAPGLQQAVHDHDWLTLQIRRRTMIEVHIRTALQQKQLYLQYQPQYEVRSGRLRGFEALLRWQHPELGSVEPEEFIPIADQTGALLPIGAWVIRQACMTVAQAIPAPSSMTISVNLSASQLLDPGLAAIVEQALADTGIEPHRLEFEIAEQALSGLLEQAELPMKRLQALGVRLTIDDYKMEADTLIHWRKLPIQSVKIDNTLLQEKLASSNEELSDSLFEAIKQLQCDIVAMRLETYEQLAFYKKNDCQFAQGNLLGRPMDSDRLQALVVAAQSVDASSEAEPFSHS
ncbi:EAL domain-containing protein [Cohnella sp. LGH]|uniref:EAL domain-containing protein n=1 Tax=Cohnella sp. LGH TaxID=1619153 RepID=UPI001ADA4D58|nr:EAL domain-containing protein [Cohnella sp. LGH]QTH45434.1 EAL domain-containing protein [Cohnella sp. LGH]